MKRVQQQRRALGSEVLLTLVAADEIDLHAVFESLWTEITLFEATFSRFQIDSELSFVNQRAGVPTVVSSEFIALAQESYHMADKTGGLYNPFILPGLQMAGYKGSWPNPATADAQTDFSDRRIVPMTEMILAEDTITLPANSALDFGGIGKGYLLDQLAAQLKGVEKIQGYWLSLGGDILLAGYDVDGQPWSIGVQSSANNEIIATAKPQDASPVAVATSGTIKRRGDGWHHIIDPRTGASADTDVLMATVCASTGTAADIYAKCLVILGSAAIEEFAKDQSLEDILVQFQTADGDTQKYQKGTIIQV